MPPTIGYIRRNPRPGQYRLAERGYATRHRSG